ncbi:hypothetical protein [Mucilaginibacter sp. SP1R1]|uniref:hypothetical protein n=1 Tax=Mucilaginibacter sp. SP1R1 TaxID=2723091 RepID=UPI0016100694|nr:hypothetical protein [Mucilaginibacter sp. SP1R1]MBB6151189.1 hypothetical protein [Mucilaginibacter sp. SP1R1]
MKYCLLLLALVAFCSTSSCNKGKGELSPSTAVIGKWRWIKSVGGIAGLTITPQTAGYNLTQEFRADSTFSILNNASPAGHGKYSIIKNYKYTDQQTINVLKLNDGPGAWLQIRNDTLFVTDIFISDGFNSSYVRVN